MGGKLHRILGFGFGLAVVVGATIGVGILRTPGEIASLLRAPALVIGIWILGGVYVVLGSLSVAELGAMLPRAGGFYVYTRHALGEGVGLLVGASDWLGLTSAVAYGATAFAEFSSILVPSLSHFESALACALILGFGLLHWRGVRASSQAQQWTTVAKAVAFIALLAACFRSPAAPSSALPVQSGLKFATSWFVALEFVIVTYDGWYSAIYFAEEDRNPGRNIPRSMIIGTLAIIALYLAINSAFLHTLGIAGLAHSKQPAADAAVRLIGPGAGRLVTALSLLSLLTLINAVIMCASRILFALSRDGMAPAGLSFVNARGTPAAMWATVAAACVLAATGTFSRLIAIAGFLFVVNHCSAYICLIVLRRRRAPGLPRPFRTPLYPWVTLAALGGAASYLLGAVLSDFRSSAIALSLIALGYPAYRVTHHLRRTAIPLQDTETT